ncbi:MAG: putative glycolipid-binding domain-containing protein [Chloroflexota bacterium]
MKTKRNPQNEVQHYLMWQQVEDVGSEYCQLRYQEQDWYLQGTVMTTFNQEPTFVEYQIRCDKAWGTRHVQIKMQLGLVQQTLILMRDEQDNWQVNGRHDQNFEGCIDVDLGITPATNTLPIRRLNLAIDESAEVFATWVRFPQLSTDVLSQKYTRLSETRYRYESRRGAFVTEFEVDSQGLVLTYPGLWERVGTSTSI